MFHGKRSLFQKVSGLALGLMICFSVSGAVGAEEKNAVDELSLYDLRNLDITVATGCTVGFHHGIVYGYGSQRHENRRKNLHCGF